MILCEWDAPEGHPGQVAYTCMLSYPIFVSHLRFNFLCLVLLFVYVSQWGVFSSTASSMYSTCMVVPLSTPSSMDVQGVSQSIACSGGRVGCVYNLFHICKVYRNRGT